MKKKYFLVVVFCIGFDLFGQTKCTPLLDISKAYDRIYYDGYELVLFQSTNMELVFSDLFPDDSNEFDIKVFDIYTSLVMNFMENYKDDYIKKIRSFYTVFEVDEIYEENVDYLIEIKYSTFKSKKNKRVLFKDGHKDYYQYIPLSGDTLRRGRLAETYQKYNSVLIGTHTWYKYQKSLNGEVERVIERRVNYDDFYPVCWSNAIKRARRKGIKAKNPELIAPIGYPNIKLEKGEAFWLIRDGVKEVKIDAYLQN